MEGLECQPYRSDHLAVVMKPDHPLASMANFGSTRSWTNPLVGLEHGASLMDLLATQAGLSQKALKLRVQMQGFEAVCRMIEAGMGVGVLPRHAAEAYLPGLKLEIRLLKDEWAVRQMLVCSVRGRERSQPLERLLQGLAAAIKEDAQLP